MKSILFKIRRYNSAHGNSQQASSPYYKTFVVKPGDKMSVLGGLLQIQDELDGSLVFRYACRWAVCGSCAMTINRKIRLACRTQLTSLKTRRVLIEPLPGLQVIKDLVVDMEPFWESYHSIKPLIGKEEPPLNRERQMSKEARQMIDQYFNCILCAACYGACPVVRMDRDKKVYLGPAALAKAYRVLMDQQSIGHKEILRELDNIAGVWGCHQALSCTLHCPKNVRPSDGIMALRRRMVRYRLSGPKSE